jgi:hypothetical protein
MLCCAAHQAVEVCHAMQCCAPGSGGLPCYAVLRTRQWRSAMLCSAAHQAVHRSASAALDVPFCRRLCCCVGAVVLQLHQQQPYDMHLHVMPGKSIFFSTVELSLALKCHTCAVLGLTGRRCRRRPPGVPHGAAAGEAAVADTGRRGAGQATGGGAGLGLVLGWCWCCTLCMCCSQSVLSVGSEAHMIMKRGPSPSVASLARLQTSGTCCTHFLHHRPSLHNVATLLRSPPTHPPLPPRPPTP